MPAGREEFEWEEETGCSTEFDEPPMYRVLLLNDDYTPMEFVVQILQDIFHKDRSEAERIMLSVHRKGSGLCGIYTYEIAETKVDRILSRAGKAGYPLRCIMEEES